MLKYYKFYKGSFPFNGSCDTIEEEINHLLCDRLDTPMEIISTTMRIKDDDTVEVVILYYEG